jgi:hypothetical protein
MSKPTTRLWIKTIGVFCAPTTREEAGQLMRDAVACLMKTATLRFEDEEDAQIFQREERSSPEWSERPVFLRGDASDYSIMLDHFWKPDERFHYLVTSPESPIEASDLPAEWAQLIERSRQLLEKLRPGAAFAWARAGKADNPFDFHAVCSKQSPYALAPWTYYHGRALNETVQKHMRSLSFAQDLAAGVAVRPVDLPGETLHPDVAAELSKIPVRYHDPLRSES